MADPQKPESLLVADIGSVNTKVGLVDRVEGEYRFVGGATTATTATPPSADVAVGIRHAIAQIEARTGRVLLTPDRQLITPERAGAQGVDAFVAIASAPPPLRVAIVGLSREVSVASATRALRGTYANVVATLALDETGRRWLPLGLQEDVVADKAGVSIAISARPGAQPVPDPAVIAAETLARANPDVIVLVGGVDGGATTALYEIANLVASIVASRDESARPVVVFAGNREARSQIAARVGQGAELRVVDNVEPALGHEDPSALQRGLEMLYCERKIAWLPGMNALTGWTATPVIPSARALENVVRYIARRFGQSVLGADLGAGSTTLVTARGESHTRIVRSDLGIGPNLEQMIMKAGIAQLMDWLPLEMDADEACLRWFNQSLHPRTLPVTHDEARLMQTAARVALSTAARESGALGGAFDLVLLTGGIATNNANLGALALLALDALQPSGVFTLAIDVLGLAPAFGALASVNAEAAAGALERDGFVTLGTVIAPISSTREGQVDLRVKVQSPGTGAMNLEVQHGSLELVPLAPGQKASIEVRAASGVNLNTPRGILKAEIEGGALGLIIDARGRPIVLPPEPEKRRTKVQQWYWDIGSEVTYG